MMNKRAVLFLSQLSVLSNCAIRSSAVIIHADIFNIFFFLTFFIPTYVLPKLNQNVSVDRRMLLMDDRNSEKSYFQRRFSYIHHWRFKIFSLNILITQALFSYSESPLPLINNFRLSADIGDT